MSDETNTIPAERYVTRLEGVKLARDLGIPLTLSGVNKDSMDGKGPKPAGRYGPAFLYKPEEFLRYVYERAGVKITEAA